MRVYVAGLYSRTPDGKVAGIIDALHNMQVGMRVATELLIAGHVPFCPWLDYQFFLMLREGETIPMDAIKAYSMEWLKVSEAILMLPGWEGSGGAKAELEEAQRLGLPVFYTKEEVLQYGKRVWAEPYEGQP